MFEPHDSVFCLDRGVKMTAIALEILFIILLLVANGVFAMSEIAVVTARKARLRQRADAGDAKARVALELANAPDRFLSTIQIGITLVGILAARSAARRLPNNWLFA